MRFAKPIFSAAVLLWSATVAAAQDRPQVIAVNYPLQFFAERLLGTDADVIFPVPSDVDPSFWRPSIADISTIQAADLILLNGAGFATWVDRVSLPRSKVVNTTAQVAELFIVTESITHSHGDGGEHSHEGLASYVWLDPALASAQAEAIAAAVIARGLAAEEDVSARLAALQADLETLDTKALEALADLKGVPMIATHPRFQYLARRYDLSITPLEWEAGELPSTAQLADLAASVAKENAKILIWEASPPQAAFDATAALGLQNVVFPPLAQAPDGQNYLQAIETALAAMGAAHGE